MMNKFHALYKDMETGDGPVKTLLEVVYSRDWWGGGVDHVVLSDYLPTLYDIQEVDGEIILKCYGELSEDDYDEFFGVDVDG